MGGSCLIVRDQVIHQGVDSTSLHSPPIDSPKYMLASVFVSQLQRGVEDFLCTTFPGTTPHVHGMLDRFFDGAGTRDGSSAGSAS